MDYKKAFYSRLEDCYLGAKIKQAQSHQATLQESHTNAQQTTPQAPQTQRKTTQTQQHPYTTLFYTLLALFVFIVLIRLVSLALYPLMDPTEARYAEMARKMLELGDFVVLHYTYESPFWGKPPLSFWSSALGMSLFGINEFGARIAPFIAGLLVCTLFFAWRYDMRDFAHLQSHKGAQNPTHARYTLALASSIIMFSTALGLVACGAVMTDEFLLVCVGLCMVGFWNCVASEKSQVQCQDLESKAINNAKMDTKASDKASQSNQKARLWGYVFFVGLGLGLLAKGPLIFVLSLVPIVGFAVLMWLFHRICQSHQISQNLSQNLAQNPQNTPAQTTTNASQNLTLHYSNLPIVSGSILALLIALPWYILCELRSEGFLEYFIIGEHFKRFLVSGWEGDLYGGAHSRKIGSIWIFFLMAFLPWSIIFAGFFARHIATFFANFKIFAKIPFMKDSFFNSTRDFAIQIAQNILTHNAKNLYLALWILAPLEFFTLSRNVLWTYVLPCVIPFSILLAQWIFSTRTKTFATYIWILPLVLVGGFGVFVPTQSAQNLLSPYHHKDIFTRFSGDSRLAFIGFNPSYSAEFYAHAKNDTLRAKNPSITPLREEIYTRKDLQECATLDDNSTIHNQGLKTCALSEILDTNERVSIAIKSGDFASFGEFFAHNAPHFSPIIESKGIILLQNFPTD